MKNFKQYYLTERDILNVPPELWEKMGDWYTKRTNMHKKKKKKYCERILESFPEFDELSNRILFHDNSKFEEPEKTPYIFISWQYKCKDEGWDFRECNPPDNIDELMSIATHHHVTTNSHHPEYHSVIPVKHNIFARDRDDPSDKKINATKMPRLDIVEMCADWAAMSEEKGNTPQDWAKKNVNIRWMFDKDQENLIYKILNNIWE